MSRRKEHKNHSSRLSPAHILLKSFRIVAVLSPRSLSRLFIELMNLSKFSAEFSPIPKSVERLFTLEQASDHLIERGLGHVPQLDRKKSHTCHVVPKSVSLPDMAAYISFYLLSLIFSQQNQQLNLVGGCNAL